MRFGHLLLAAVPTTLAQLLDYGGGGNRQVDSQIAALPGEFDALVGSVAADHPLGDSHPSQLGHAGTGIDQVAALAIKGFNSPSSPMTDLDSPNNFALRPDSSRLQSNQAQNLLGSGGPRTSQHVPDASIQLAEGYPPSSDQINPPSRTRRILRARSGAVCRNVPIKNDNPRFYPGGEGRRIEDEKAEFEQQEKQCNPIRQTVCCNGPRQGIRNIEDCSLFYFGEPRCDTGGIYCCERLTMWKWPPWIFRGVNCDSLFYRPDNWRPPKDWWPKLHQ